MSLRLERTSSTCCFDINTTFNNRVHCDNMRFLRYDYDEKLKYDQTNLFLSLCYTRGFFVFWQIKVNGNSAAIIRQETRHTQI